MSKEIELLKEEKDLLMQDLNIGNPEYVNMDSEADVDDGVKELLKKYYNPKNIKTKKTGIKDIDSKIPSYHGDSGRGQPDIMIFNYFNDNEIDVIVENKNITNKEDAILQAKRYATIGEIIHKPVRIIIGNNPAKIWRLK